MFSSKRPSSVREKSCALFTFLFLFSPGSTMVTTTPVNVNLPPVFIDPHQHFLDPVHNKFQSFLKSLNAPSYSPEQYKSDVLDPLLTGSGIRVEGTVHVEAMPDDGTDEVKWIQSMIDSKRCDYVKAIVASCDLASPDAETKMVDVMASSPIVKGVRWILDCVGKYDGGNTATHVATTRHDGVDYLRGSEGGYDGEVVPGFERGFALLGKYGLSFDLQCAPAQLVQAAKLFERYPNVPVVIDHLGKPRTVLGDDDPTNENTTPNAEELRVWREGMQAMAAVPHVHVKISMLGYAVPGWIRSAEREAVLRSLVIETIDLFGPRRCMVATNWWANGKLSDSDGISEVSPTPTELIEKLATWFSQYSDDDRRRLFSETAREFYRI